MVQNQRTYFILSIIKIKWIMRVQVTFLQVARTKVEINQKLRGFLLSYKSGDLIKNRKTQ